MLSRVLGLARDIVFARFIGSEAGADAFFVAFKIPNFLRRLFAEGAFAQAFIPILAEYRQRGSVAAVRHFIDRVAGCLGLTLLTLTLVAVIGSPVLAMVFAPGFYLDYPQKYALTSDMIRITFPYLMLISLTGLAGAILNSYDRFAVPAFTPVLLNIVLITAAIVVAPRMSIPVMALAWGVLVAGVVQFLFQLPFLMRLGLLPHPKVEWADPAVVRVLQLMAPAIFGVSVSQINLLLDTLLASFLPTGSVSWLYYSDRLTELPLGVFAVGIATVILPNLSRQHKADCEGFKLTLDWALRLILVIALPAAFALILLAEPILYTLFQYGKTSPRDIAMASYSLQAYALGLSAFMLIKVLAPGYFARKDMLTPVRIGIIAMVSNMLMNILFVIPLHHFWQIGHVGLALATALSAFVNAALLLRGLKQQGAYIPQPGWLGFVARVFAACLAMVLTIWWLSNAMEAWHSIQWWQRSWQLSVVCALGLSVYLLGLFFSGLRLADFRRPAA